MLFGYRLFGYGLFGPGTTFLSIRSREMGLGISGR
jgi:hypothetical protein